MQMMSSTAWGVTEAHLPELMEGCGAMPSTVGITERACRKATSPLVVATLVVVVLAGCASQSATAPPPAVSTPAPTTVAPMSAELCSAAAQYQTAANAIMTLNATQVGTDGVKKALQDLETAANNLGAAAQ